ncbi:tRNA (cytidine(34)-2'-O)-methyltransferase [Poriferisphaera corsica]|uniref:Putative tRNA (cytidine(34)-2'-O)-methyltransferase n=1 Tax=Poriferisphaera corsica TaxID=2528020 RepID=A0A517YRV7_9BACT|nr:tRNA (cytidine(34)-2'-O)-methyltransferase [Poriferisphaera corsica]QDU32953.1 tRNA (cytidine(34)-2'-O)-methyltransferase [Poriferisphaera corsica]
MIHVALYQPAIPPNTGNIARQCVGMNAHLHIIGPTKFEITDTNAKRAGLDYWDDLTITLHEDDDAFLEWLGDRQPYLVTKFGEMRFDGPAYQDGDVLIFGNENTGLPESWREKYAKTCIYVPIPGPVRSYNLSNTAAIVLTQASLKAGLLDKHILE